MNNFLNTLVVSVSLAACGGVEGVALDEPDAGDVPGPDGGDVAPDGAPRRCDPSGDFGTPVQVPSLSTEAGWDTGARLALNETIVVFARRAADNVDGDLYIAARPSADEPFGEPQPLLSVNSLNAESGPSLSEDGLTLAFMRSNGAWGADSNGQFDIFISTRSSLTAEFGTPSPVLAVNTGWPEGDPVLAPDGSAVYFWREVGAGDVTILVSALGPGGFTEPVEVPGVGSSTIDAYPVPGAAETTIFFASSRTPVDGGYDIWQASRSSILNSFGSPERVAALSSSGTDFPTWVSADGCRLLLSSDRGGAYDIYESRRAE